jgi:hypothetical protein
VKITQQAEAERKLMQTIEAAKKEEDEIQQRANALAKQLGDVLSRQGHMRLSGGGGAPMLARRS